MIFVGGILVSASGKALAVGARAGRRIMSARLLMTAVGVSAMIDFAHDHDLFIGRRATAGTP